MAKKPETKFRAKLVKELRRIPRSVWHSIQQRTIKGTPDLLGCVRGRFVALEVKETEASKTDRLQLHKILVIRRAGGVAMIVHKGNLEERLKEIEDL